ncbi:hypothetical protein CapIbe_022907 [Capra ibex]
MIVEFSFDHDTGERPPVFVICALSVPLAVPSVQPFPVEIMVDLRVSCSRWHQFKRGRKFPRISRDCKGCWAWHISRGGKKGQTACLEEVHLQNQLPWP